MIEIQSNLGQESIVRFSFLDWNLVYFSTTNPWSFFEPLGFAGLDQNFSKHGGQKFLHLVVCPDSNLVLDPQRTQLRYVYRTPVIFFLLDDSFLSSDMAEKKTYMWNTIISITLKHWLGKNIICNVLYDFTYSPTSLIT